MHGTDSKVHGTDAKVLHGTGWDAGGTGPASSNCGGIGTDELMI
jgi:hypothetical protein